MSNVLDELKNYHMLLNKEAWIFRQEMLSKELPKAHRDLAKKRFYHYSNTADVVSKIIDAFIEADPKHIEDLEKTLTAYKGEE